MDADDAWSETFLSAMRAYPDLPDGANVEAWLVTIAHRKAIDVHRALGRRAVPIAEPPDGASTPGPAERFADHDGLYDALKQLPSKQRQAVAYHHIVGLPHREVAGVLGGSEAAARRASSDGIKTLRSIYEQERASR